MHPEDKGKSEDHLAEKFPSTETAEPGTVMEIDPANPGTLRISRGANNRRVAGIVSGANGLLSIELLRELPEAKRPRKIAINTAIATTPKLVESDKGEAA